MQSTLIARRGNIYTMGGIHWTIDEYNHKTLQHEPVYYKMEFTGRLWRKTQASYAVDRTWVLVTK
jgi:hypothetical protein